MNKNQKISIIALAIFATALFAGISAVESSSHSAFACGWGGCGGWGGGCCGGWGGGCCGGCGGCGGWGGWGW